MVHKSSQRWESYVQWSERGEALKARPELVNSPHGQRGPHQHSHDPDQESEFSHSETADAAK